MRLKAAPLLSATYAAIVAVTFFLYLRLPDSSLAWLLLITLTLPWSILVILSGFLLIHMISNGIDYALALAAVVNCFLIYWVTALIYKWQSGLNREG